ncbi:hypothetical protein RJT34_33124 [Clitoria ternatea]|uniref:Uncharacterized protein n=1 Tax=Clitoria ternatea TaxID=43366 RepID=A0AAN9EYR0_CLITE
MYTTGKKKDSSYSSFLFPVFASLIEQQTKKLFFTNPALLREREQRSSPLQGKGSSQQFARNQKLRKEGEQTMDTYLPEQVEMRRKVGCDVMNLMKGFEHNIL